MSRVLVTGSTDGIGKETARQLLAAGHDVVVHGRGDARVDGARAELARSFPGRVVEGVVGDFASLDSVRAMASKVSAIDVLLNNAGIYANDPVLTVDGFESTFAVNHLAPFLLTHLVLPKVALRVVNVSSIAHSRGRLEPRTWRSLVDYDHYDAYAQSKLANVLFTVELARRLPMGKTTVSLHPGVVSTKLLTEGFGMQGGDSLSEGAATSVFLATSDKVENGAYYVRKKVAQRHATASDARLVRDFYLKSCAMVGIEPLGG